MINMSINAKMIFPHPKKKIWHMITVDAVAPPGAVICEWCSVLWSALWMVNVN